MQASGVPLCPHARDYLSRVNLWSVVRTDRAAARSVRTVKPSARFRDS